MHGLADAVSGDSGQADAGFGFGLAGVARDGQELQTVGRLAAQAGDGLAGLIDAWRPRMKTWGRSVGKSTGLIEARAGARPSERRACQ